MASSKAQKVGLTLAELLLTLALVSIALLALIGVYVYAFRLQGRGADLASGSQVAQELMERVKFRGYDKIAVGNYDGRPLVYSPPDVATGFPPAPYPRTQIYGQDFSIVVQASQFQPHSRLVNITVYWSNGRKVTFGTVIHQ